MTMDRENNDLHNYTNTENAEKQQAYSGGDQSPGTNNSEVSRGEGAITDEKLGDWSGRTEGFQQPVKNPTGREILE